MPENILINGINFTLKVLEVRKQGTIPEAKIPETTLASVYQDGDNDSEYTLCLISFILEDLEELEVSKNAFPVTDNLLLGAKYKIYFSYEGDSEDKFRNFNIHYKTKKEPQNDHALYYLKISYTLTPDASSIGFEKLSIQEIDHAEEDPKTKRGTRTIIKQ